MTKKKNAETPVEDLVMIGEEVTEDELQDIVESGIEINGADEESEQALEEMSDELDRMAGSAAPSPVPNEQIVINNIEVPRPFEYRGCCVDGSASPVTGRVSLSAVVHKRTKVSANGKKNFYEAKIAIQKLIDDVLGPEKPSKPKK